MATSENVNVGLGHSQPLRSLPSPNTGIALVHGKGVAVAGGKLIDLKEEKDEEVIRKYEVHEEETSEKVSAPVPVSIPRPLESSGDSLDREADVFLSRSGVRPPVLEDEERGIDRTRALCERRAWVDVCRVTSELLQTSTSPYACFYSDLLNIDVYKLRHDNTTILRLEKETAEIIALRFTAMLKLRRYSDLGRGVDRLNLLEDPTRLPHWVSYGLQILAAHTIQYTDSSQRCFDTLHLLKDKIVKENNLRWLTTLNNTLSNAFIREKQWRLALASFYDTLLSLPSGIHIFLTEDLNLNEPDQIRYLSQAFEISSRIQILSRQARVFLQIGAITEAEYIFESAKNELPKLHSVLDSLYKLSSESDNFLCQVKESSIIQQAPIQIILNEGLIYFAKEEYHLAMEKFTLAIDTQRKKSNKKPNKTNCFFQEDILASGFGFIVEDDTIISSCLNNIALCSLHTCHMHKAIDMMENLVLENPTKYLTECLAFNLCTLYELGSENSVSSRKKSLLQHIAKRFYLHDITPESFRIH